MIKKRTSVWLLMFLVSTCALLAQTQTPHLFIKFNGTAISSSAGDFGEFVDKNGGATTARYFRGFGGEIGLEAKKHAIGIGAGYIERYLDTGSLPDAPGAASGPAALARHSFSAIPIFLFIRYKIVNGSFLKISLTLGEGVYLATYQEKTAETVLLKCRKNSLGFHGGLSADLQVFKFFAIFIDGGYRFVSFKEITGRDYQSGIPIKGDLYYQSDQATGQYVFFIRQAQKNSLPGSRPAVLDLKGFVLSAGLKIIF